MTATLKSYTVRFVEWAVYDGCFDAPSPQEAMRLAYTAFCNDGPEGFRCPSNGTECWTAETEGEPVLEVDHPSELDDAEGTL